MKEVCMLEGFGIAVVERGFVYVGRLALSDDWCVITNAQNIRVWGTTEGLGQLALKGPQSATKLDQCGTVRIPRAALVHIIDTEAALWSA